MNKWTEGKRRGGKIRRKEKRGRRRRRWRGAEEEEGSKKGRSEKAGEEEGVTGGLPARLWEMLMMLRTVRPRLEVKDTQVPACRRTGLGLPVGHGNQFRLVVSWFMRRVRFSMLPGICSQESRLRVAGDCRRQETGPPEQKLVALEPCPPPPFSEAHLSSLLPHPTLIVLFCPWRSVSAAVQPGRPYLSVGTTQGSFLI